MTLIVEVEAILNSWPLTYVYPDDVDEPLTPSHLIMGRQLLSIPDGKLAGQPENVNESGALTRRERYLSTLLNPFWKRWRKEYLLELREYHNLSVRRNRVAAIRVGDVVTVPDDAEVLPRSQWRLGKIMKLVEGRDRVIRGAEVRVNSKGG